MPNPEYRSPGLSHTESSPLIQPQVPSIGMTLSPDQQAAYTEIRQWLSDQPEGEKEISLGGYAGTGKTTLLKYMIDKFDSWSPQVMSLTGKACSVLVKKGVNAQTIHSSIYYVHTEKKRPVFTLRTSIEDDPDLLIIDEASMVSLDLYRDLLSFGLPVLWVGDHGQLEPIGRNPGIMKNPDIKLEKIHRQAEGNPIIMFADKIRQGGIPAAICPKGNATVEMLNKRKIDEDKLVQVDQIIVGLNRTRVKMNKIVRALRKFPPMEVVVGDRLVCLKNDRRQGLFNGLQARVLTIEADKTQPVYHVKLDLDSGLIWSGDILMEQFNKDKGLHEPDRALWSASYFDYAYAITCHKSQGSEWPTVMVVEESAGKLWSMPRWRYTAITRASERLLYAC